MVGDAASFAALSWRVHGEDDGADARASELERALGTRDEDGRTAFHAACGAGATGRDVVRLAVERCSRARMRALARGVDEGGWTPLHTAAALGEAETCGTLLAAGADASARTPGGQTPAHYAASKGHVEVLAKIASAGDEGWWAASDETGATPLHRAAASGKLRAIDYLVDALSNGRAEVPKGALEARDKRGQTPLLTACESGQEEAAIRLARHGADVNARNAEKQGIEELAPKLVSALRQIAEER